MKAGGARDLIVAWLIVVVLSPLTSWPGVKIDQAIWGWFLAPQYGAGPSFLSWFGIQIFLSSVVVALRYTRTSNKDEENPLDYVLYAVLGAVFLNVALLADAFWIHEIWG